jgi:hypothetical protein
VVFAHPGGRFFLFGPIDAFGGYRDTTIVQARY